MANMQKPKMTEVKRAAKDERQRLYELFMHAPAAIAVVSGPELVFELANKPYHQLVGKDRKLEGRPLNKAVPDIEPGLLKIIKNVAFKGERFVANEAPILLDWDYNGKPYTKYLNFIYEPLYNEHKKPDGLMAFAYDVSEQVKARQKVEESEERYRTILNTIDQGFCVIEVLFDGAKKPIDYCFLEANGVFEKQTGLKQAIGKTMRQLVPNIEARWFEVYGRVAVTGKPIRFVDHSEAMGRSFDVYASRVGPKKNCRVAILFTDITERILATEILAESEARLRFMAESMPQKVFSADADGNVDYMNEEWVKFTGLSFQQIKDWGWTQFIHPDDVEENIRSWQHSIDTGEAFQLEHRFRRHDGVYHWHLSRARPMRDERGTIIRWYGSNTDIEENRSTIKRRDELEDITTTLREQRAQLLALNKTKDEFISLASHQLRTPASAVKQFLGMLLEGYAGDLSPQQKGLLTQASDSNERQITIVNDLLKVALIDAGKVHLNKQTVDLVELITNVIGEQAAKFEGRRQTVTFTHKQKSLMGKVDSDRIRMVLENLIDNASKYTHANKKIEVEVSKVKDRVVIAVKDQGVGIAKKDLNKLFRKFSRLDNSLSVLVGGSGLGLYWAKKIVDLHGGTIDVQSTPNKGTSFIISLPV